jgi:hypothetical protein
MAGDLRDYAILAYLLSSLAHFREVPDDEAIVVGEDEDQDFFFSEGTRRDLAKAAQEFANLFDTVEKQHR